MPDAVRVGKVQTVGVLVEPSKLGPTLTHEHLLIDLTLPLGDRAAWAATRRHHPETAEELEFWHAPVTIENLSRLSFGSTSNRDCLILDDERVATEEIRSFVRSGGGAIVDITSRGLKPRPKALRRLSGETGVPIVMGTGWYRRPWHPPDVADRSVDRLAERMIADVMVGFEGTDVRAGILGELGAEDDDSGELHPDEIKVLHAAAIAQRVTGVSMSVHTIMRGREPSALRHLLSTFDVPPDRVVIDHADTAAREPGMLRSVLDTGVYVSFDLLGMPRGLDVSDAEVARAIVDLVEDGYAEQILLSHDLCTKNQCVRWGGHGLAYVLGRFVPHLASQGVPAHMLDTITIENPARVLSIR